MNEEQLIEIMKVAFRQVLDEAVGESLIPGQDIKSALAGLDRDLRMIQHQINQWATKFELYHELFQRNKMTIEELVRRIEKLEKIVGEQSDG